MHTIVPATLQDAPHMLALQRLAFVEEARRSGTEDFPPLTEGLDAIVAHIQTQTALTARDGGQLIGAVRGVVTDGVCLVRSLVIAPGHQGQGIGSALLKALEQAMPDVLRFDLTTNTVMEGNVPFYERHGYRVTELTRVSDLVTLAQMSKPGAAAA